jgi:hypothetical protein
MSPELQIPESRLARTAAGLALTVVAAALLLVPSAAGLRAAPDKTSITSHPLLGISGNAPYFQNQTGQVSQIDQAFLGWGQGLTWGQPFAALLPAFGPIPMLHLGTAAKNGAEAITPGGIASGSGDAYLIALNHAISAWGKAIYIRPMAEMNNGKNYYSAFTAAGGMRDPAHSTASYKKAFQRIYLILHGGTTAAVNARLRALGMPALGPSVSLLVNPFPTLRIVWSPLAASNPRVPGNEAQQYYPGVPYVDVEGGDIYDEMLSDTAPWNGLEALFQTARGRGEPFAIPEWGLNGVDDPAFIYHMCNYLKTNHSIEAAVFYESHPGSAFDLVSKPKSRAAYRACVTPLGGTYPSWALENAPGGGARVLALSLKPAPASGGSPLPVTFSIQAKLNVAIVHWEVLFGDGGEIDGNGKPPATLKHTYKTDGVYHAVLFVFRAPPFTPDATPFFTSADVTAGTSGTPALSFVPTPSSGPKPLSVSFKTDLHIPGTATSWTTIYGDGYDRHETGPPPHFSGHTFMADGTYDVLMIIGTSSGAQYAAVAPITVGHGGGTTTTTTTTTSGPPPPATGKTKGVILIGGKPFTGGHVPYHVTVDVTHGTLSLTTDTGTVDLYGANGLPAQFKLYHTTDHGHAVVEMILEGGKFSGCPRKKASALESSATKPKPKTPVRSLWGSGKGKFETKGRYAAATVRGTTWFTEDFCNGTLIVVKKGVVQVYDVKLKKFITITGGHSYFAAA